MDKRKCKRLRDMLIRETSPDGWLIYEDPSLAKELRKVVMAMQWLLNKYEQSKELKCHKQQSREM